MKTTKAKMKKFEVLVSRISYASHIIKVEAENEEKAKEKAIDEAGDIEFNDHDADYVADSVEEIE